MSTALRNISIHAYQRGEKDSRNSLLSGIWELTAVNFSPYGFCTFSIPIKNVIHIFFYFLGVKFSRQSFSAQKLVTIGTKDRKSLLSTEVQFLCAKERNHSFQEVGRNLQIFNLWCISKTYSFPQKLWNTVIIASIIPLNQCKYTEYSPALNDIPLLHLSDPICSFPTVMWKGYTEQAWRKFTHYLVFYERVSNVGSSHSTYKSITSIHETCSKN